MRAPGSSTIVLLLAACGGVSDGDGGGGERRPLDAEGASRIGDFFIQYAEDEQEGARVSATGFFLDYSEGDGISPDGYDVGGARADCTSLETDDCELVECRYETDASIVFNEVRYVSAGAITVSPGGSGVVTIEPSVDLVYIHALDLPDDAAAGGQPYFVEAVGEEVPAFE